MMPEISLNVLDIAQNSIRAQAKLIGITVTIDHTRNLLTVIIKDDGCGMSQEQIKNVSDPFYTTRTTRKVGLGIPFFQYAATVTGGSFDIQSEVGAGTQVTATFVLSHIDRMPLGDMTSTMHTLITLNSEIDFLYTYTIDESSFVLDTREFREVLGDIPFYVPDVSTYIKEYLSDNKAKIEEVFGKVE